MVRADLTSKEEEIEQKRKENMECKEWLRIETHVIMGKERNIREKEEKLSIVETNGEVKVKKLKSQIDTLKIQLNKSEEKEVKLKIELGNVKGEKETAMKKQEQVQREKRDLEEQLI